MEDSQQNGSAATVELNDGQGKGDKEKLQKDTTRRSLRSSGRSRSRHQSGSRSPKRKSSRSGRSPTTQSRRNSGEGSASKVTKRRSGRSPKPLSGSSQARRRENESKERTSPRQSGEQKERKKKKRSSSADDIRLVDSDEAAADDPPGLQRGSQAGDILVPFASPSASVKKRAGSPKSPRSSKSPKRQSGRRSGRRKNGDKLKSLSINNSSHTTSSTLSTGVATGLVIDDGAEGLPAETVNEQSEANRERIRDLEVQSDQIQQRMQNASKKGKKGNLGQDAGSNGGRRITICKVLGIAAVYLAGVATGFLLSESRQRKSSPAKEIYVTQSPTPELSKYPTTSPTEFSYDHPTEEDCFAIESKEEVEGQDGMITRSYDVHFDVQLNDASTNWYEQLEVGATDSVVPELACCKVPTEQRSLLIESPAMELSIRGHTRMLRNIRCVVANGSARGDFNDNGESCVELTGLCLPAVVTFDLTLKGDEPDGDIIDLVRNVINGDGSEPLVEKFDLERNVFSVVKLVDVVEHVPTKAPVVSSPTTSRPTLSPTMTSAPVVGPTTNAPTRVVTSSPTTRPATPKPTPGGTKSPTIAPAPGVTPRPTSEPSARPTLEPSPGPSESPSSSPTPAPTLLASSSPTASPSTPVPSLMPSTAPSGKREVLEAILTPFVGTVDTQSLDWLSDTDTWSPPVTEADPDTMWVERYALVKFYFATNGDSWTDKGGWMSSDTICNWTPDIIDTCNGNNRLRKIDLNAFGLSGTVPTEIGLLQNLEVCDIDNNGIGGTIPTEIGLPLLKDFEIDNNDITGTIPSELGLTAMTFLDLSRNKLKGKIPIEVLSLSTLSWFLVKSNQLTGTIGSELGIMSNDCSITGSIPSEIGQAILVKNLDFDNNALSGTIPTTVGQLTKLTAIDFDWTSLSGPVPTELGRLTALKALDLDYTNLGGTIPSEFNLLTNLEHLEMDFTQVSGTIPNLGALVNLDTLGFGNCKLTGSFPPGMFNNMVKLEEINFSLNSLTGGIPALPNPSLLTICSYSNNCFTTDLANAGSCDLTNNCV